MAPDCQERQLASAIRWPGRPRDAALLATARGRYGRPRRPADVLSTDGHVVRQTVPVDVLRRCRRRCRGLAVVEDRLRAGADDAPHPPWFQRLSPIRLRFGVCRRACSYVCPFSKRMVVALTRGLRELGRRGRCRSPIPVGPRGDHHLEAPCRSRRRGPWMPASLGDAHPALPVARALESAPASAKGPPQRGASGSERVLVTPLLATTPGESPRSTRSKVRPACAALLFDHLSTAPPGSAGLRGLLTHRRLGHRRARFIEHDGLDPGPRRLSMQRRAACGPCVSRVPPRRGAAHGRALLIRFFGKPSVDEDLRHRAVGPRR